jgi:hypothetical protein
MNESVKKCDVKKKKTERKRRNEMNDDQIHAIFDLVVLYMEVETANHVERE